MRVRLGSADSVVVHRQHALLRQVVVHDAEDGLLDLPRVLGAADQRQPLAQVDQDEGAAAGAVHFRHGLEVGHVEHGERGLEVLELRRVRLVDEHVLGEEAVPRRLADHPHREPVARVRPGIAVEEVDVAVLQIGEHLALERVEGRRVEGDVDLPPPDVALARRFPDGELVVGGAARVLAGLHQQRPARSQLPGAPAQGVLDQAGGGEIAIHAADVEQAGFLDAVIHGGGPFVR